MRFSANLGLPLRAFVPSVADRLGGEAISRPVTFQEIFATVYNRLGIDAASNILTDLRGRPRFVLDDPTLIQELV